MLKPRTGWGADSLDTLGTNLVNLNLAVSFETQHMLTLMQMASRAASRASPT
jgi:hypothetical protein